jgi:hypothetical protein
MEEEFICYKTTWSPCGRFYGLGKGNILCPWFKVCPLYFREEELGFYTYKTYQEIDNAHSSDF